MRIAVVVCLLIAIAAICVYAFLPATQTLRIELPCNVSAAAAQRGLGDSRFWDRAIKGVGEGKDSTAITANVQHRIVNAIMGQIDLVTSTDDGKFESSISIVNLKQNSIVLTWTAKLHAGNNIIKRLRNISSRNLLHETFGRQLLMLRNALEDTKMLYGFTIEKGMMTDSVLLTRIITTSKRPRPEEYYPAINSMAEYAIQKGVDTTNFPMMHIKPLQEDKVQMQVALPIQFGIAAAAPFKVKFMILGKNLHTTVVGSQRSVDSAFAALYNYVDDYSIGMPAIPYASLITNRLQQADSTKWVSKVYFPVY